MAEAAPTADFPRVARFEEDRIFLLPVMVHDARRRDEARAAVEKQIEHKMVCGVLLFATACADRQFSPPKAHASDLRRARQAADLLALAAAEWTDILTAPVGGETTGDFVEAAARMLESAGLVPGLLSGLSYEEMQSARFAPYIVSIASDTALEAAPVECDSMRMAETAEWLEAHAATSVYVTALAIRCRCLAGGVGTKLTKADILPALAKMSSRLRLIAAREWLRFAPEAESVMEEWTTAEELELRLLVAGNAAMIWDGSSDHEGIARLMRDPHPWVRAFTIDAVPVGPVSKQVDAMLREALVAECEVRLVCWCHAPNVGLTLPEGQCVECGIGMNPLARAARRLHHVKTTQRAPGRVVSQVMNYDRQVVLAEF